MTEQTIKLSPQLEAALGESTQLPRAPLAQSLALPDERYPARITFDQHGLSFVCGVVTLEQRIRPSLSPTEMQELATILEHNKLSLTGNLGKQHFNTTIERSIRAARLNAAFLNPNPSASHAATALHDFLSQEIGSRDGSCYKRHDWPAPKIELVLNAPTTAQRIDRLISFGSAARKLIEHTKGFKNSDLEQAARMVTAQQERRSGQGVLAAILEENTPEVPLEQILAQSITQTSSRCSAIQIEVSRETQETNRRHVYAVFEIVLENRGKTLTCEVNSTHGTERCNSLRDLLSHLEMCAQSGEVKHINFGVWSNAISRKPFNNRP